MTETTGVKQKKVIDEHYLALPKATKSHRNLLRRLHSLGAFPRDGRR